MEEIVLEIIEKLCYANEELLYLILGVVEDELHQKKRGRK